MACIYTEHATAPIAEIRVVGRVTEHDMDEILPKLEAFIDTHGSIRIIEVIEKFDGFDPTTTNYPVITDVDGNGIDDRTVERMAQFAVNYVDALDADDVITRFEYDPDLSDGWNVLKTMGSGIDDGECPFARMHCVPGGCFLTRIRFSREYRFHTLQSKAKSLTEVRSKISLAALRLLDLK